jgi:hypothetical protein
VWPADSLTSSEAPLCACGTKLPLIARRHACARGSASLRGLCRLVGAVPCASFCVPLRARRRRFLERHLLETRLRPWQMSSVEETAARARMRMPTMQPTMPKRCRARGRPQPRAGSAERRSAFDSGHPRRRGCVASVSPVRGCRAGRSLPRALFKPPVVSRFAAAARDRRGVSPVSRARGGCGSERGPDTGSDRPSSSPYRAPRSPPGSACRICD